MPDTEMTNCTSFVFMLLLYHTHTHTRHDNNNNNNYYYYYYKSTDYSDASLKLQGHFTHQSKKKRW